MFGGVPKAEAAALDRYWTVWPSLKAELYADEGGCCLSPKEGDLAEMVRSNADVQTFVDAFDQSLLSLPNELRFALIDDPSTVDVLAEEGVVNRTIEQAIEGLQLIDPYDAYQCLDDAWRDIAIDLEIIQTEGFDAVRKVDPSMVLKKVKGVDTEVQDGWTGHVLPFKLVQEQLLAGDLSVIAENESRISQIDQELSELLENMDEEEKGSTDAVNDDGDSFVAAALNKAVKALKGHAESDFDQALVRAKELIDEQKKVKKQVKDALFELEEKTREVMASLTDEQCRALLEVKWIDPLMAGLRSLSQNVLDEFVAEVRVLNEKYATTYADVCSQIDAAEKELVQMLGQLMGNDYDMAGIHELMSLLGGE